MITKEQIDRINELVIKSKETELSEDEKKSRQSSEGFILTVLKKVLLPSWTTLTLLMNTEIRRR
mgnify:CR=1 FL=1